MHLFMFLMLAVWGFLYVNGRQRTDAVTQGWAAAQAPTSCTEGREAQAALAAIG